MTPANVDNVFRSMMAAIRASFGSALQGFLGGVSALPIANGGTAATDASTALTNLGGLADDYKYLIPTNKTGDWNPTDADAGAQYNFFGTGAHTLTINPNSTTAINLGATYVIRNGGDTALSIARGSGVSLMVNGSTSSANAVLAVGGVATLIKWGADFWTITGVGLS